MESNLTAHWFQVHKNILKFLECGRRRLNTFWLNKISMETRNLLYKQRRLQQTNLWEVWPKCCYGSEEDDDDGEGFERYGEGTRVEKTLLRGVMRQTPSSQIRLRLQLVWELICVCVCVCVCAAEVSVYNGTDRVTSASNHFSTLVLHSHTHTSYLQMLLSQQF